MEHHVNRDLSAFVPSLTRHAQIVAGSQQAAAEQVRLCLEMLAAQPERLSGEDCRFDLFRAFHDLWSPDRPGAAGNHARAVAADLETGAANLEKCVLHLVEVEGFCEERVAEILSIDKRRIAEILRRRKRHQGSPVHASVLIIEDDVLIAKHLNEVAQELGLTVNSVADGVEGAVTAARNQKPAVILTDIQLRKGQSGLVAIRAILQRRRVPVVFVTGYPWMLDLKGERNQTFVVAKPFRTHALKATIIKALDHYSRPENAEATHEGLLSKLSELLDGRQVGAFESRLH